MAKPGGTGPVGPFPASVSDDDEARDTYDRLRRRVLWTMPSGLYVVGSTDGGQRRNGMTLNWATQVSFEPKLVAISVEKEALTHELVAAAKVFSLCLIDREDRAIVRKFTKPVDVDLEARTLNGFAYVDGVTGAPILTQSTAYLDCRVAEEVDCGGHTLFLGEVVDTAFLKDEETPVLRMEDTRHELRRLTTAPGDRPAFSGAVLTGGRSTRMGTDKAFVEVGGRPMAALVAAALRAAGAAEVMAVGGDLDRLPSLGFDRTVADEHPGEGPLGGLLTALAAARHDVVVVLACDVPGVSAEAVVAVVRALGEHDVAVATTERLEPLHGAGLEPLHGAWRATRCRPVLAGAFEGGERAVHRVLRLLDVAEVVVADPAALRSVNRPADLPG